MDRADPDMPDPRLGLLFLCAHPAIDRAVRTPHACWCKRASFLVPARRWRRRLPLRPMRRPGAGLRRAPCQSEARVPI